MSHSHKHLLIATLLAAAGVAAFAQGTPGAGGPGMGPGYGMGPGMGMGGPGMGMQQGAGPRGYGQWDPAKMQARMAERHHNRMLILKDKLKITAAQEGAWTSFTTAMQPPAVLPQRPDPAAMEKLTTPERIDQMTARKVQRDAEMAKRASATKAFYATLTPEQQKTFDSVSMRAFQGGRHGRHGGMMHHG